MAAKKSSGSRSQYVNFGGWCPDPEVDHDLFKELPQWRQQELLKVRKIFRENPTVRAFEIHDPSTGKPYPNQLTVEMVIRREAARRDAAQTTVLPDTFRFHIPEAIPPGMLQLEQQMKHIYKPVTEELISNLALYIKSLDITAVCSRDRSLDVEKPSNGIYAFIWRLARFNNGNDYFIPVSAYWDLEAEIERLYGVVISTYESADELRPILTVLGAKAKELVEAIGGNGYGGSLRWAEATELIG